MENVRAVERAFELLECFSEARKEIGLSELSRNLGLPKATVLRLARTLESKGYIFQNEENQTYRLGPKVLSLGNVFLSNLDYRMVAFPYMKALRDQTQETVTLYVLNGNEQRICVQRVESHHTLQPAVNIGDSLPLNRGSAGKLLVAFHYLAVDGVDPLELRTILEQGYAVSVEEREQGLSSISAPIRNNKGQVLAALSVSGSAFRFSREKIEEHVKEVLLTADQISTQLGYLH